MNQPAAVAPTWTPPLHGVQHLESTDRRYRATVSDYGFFVQLLLWTPGCGFDAEQSTKADIAAAKEAGEKWLAEVTAR